jgi:hypothetical protein
MNIINYAPILPNLECAKLCAYYRKNKRDNCVSIDNGANTGLSLSLVGKTTMMKFMIKQFSKKMLIWRAAFSKNH